MMRALPALLLLLAGCGGEGDDSAGAVVLPTCVLDNPMGDPQSDLSVDLGLGADVVSAACSDDDGEACPTDDWNVGRAAALCIAEERGYEPAVHRVAAYLYYDGEVDRPCWAVNWSWDTDDMQFDVLLVLDVLEGSIVDEDAWSKTHDEEPC